MAAAKCVLVRVDAGAGLTIEEGQQVQRGQPIGECRAAGGNVVAPFAGRVSCVHRDAAGPNLLVFIDLEGARRKREE